MAHEPVVMHEVHTPVRVDGLRTLVRLLDDVFVIPGTSFRFGLDSLIGLIPGAGDIAGGLMSSAVILTAARAGAPKTVIARMLGNAVIDSVVGTVPLLGDLFDAGWKSNRKNLNLLESYLERPHQTQKASMLFVAGAIVVLLLAVAGSILLAVLLMRALWNWGATP
jgi:hypothetical protein